MTKQIEAGPFLEADGAVIGEEQEKLLNKYTEYDQKTLDAEMRKKEEELFGLYEEGTGDDGKFSYANLKSISGGSSEKRRKILLHNSELSAMSHVSNELDRIAQSKKSYEENGSFVNRRKAPVRVKMDGSRDYSLYGMMMEKLNRTEHESLDKMLTGQGSLKFKEGSDDGKRAMHSLFATFLHPDFSRYGLGYEMATVQTSDGVPPPEQRLANIERAVEAGIEFMPMIRTMPVGSQDANYLKETIAVGANVTAENAAFQEGDVSYAEEALHFSNFTINIPVTEIQLRETPIARRLLNEVAPAQVLKKVENDILQGNGNANNLKGLVKFNWAGVNKLAAGGTFAAAGDQDWIKLFAEARRDCRKTGFVAPNAVLASVDAWYYSTTKLLAGDRYALPPVTVPAVMPVMSVWGMRVWETTRFDASAVNTVEAVVGAFSSKLVFYIRDNLSFQWGTSGTDFESGRVRIRAQMRGALEVTRPQAFATIANASS